MKHFGYVSENDNQVFERPAPITQAQQQTDETSSKESQNSSEQISSVQRKIAPPIPWEVFETSEEIVRTDMLSSKQRHDIIIVATFVDKRKAEHLFFGFYLILFLQ